MTVRFIELLKESAAEGHRSHLPAERAKVDELVESTGTDGIFEVVTEFGD